MTSITTDNIKLINDLVTRLEFRDGALRHIESATQVATLQDQQEHELKTNIDSVENLINIRKVKVLQDIYVTNENLAIQKLLWYALFTILMTTVVAYMGIRQIVSPTVSLIICCGWWVSLLGVCFFTGKVHTLRDKTEWDKFAFDLPAN